MRPKAVLLLVALAALVLPWAGWQLVQQMEALLRQGQEQAQIAAAQAIARALAATLPELPPSGPAVFVQDVEAAKLVDGSDDDWFEHEPARSSDGRVGLRLADDGVALYALIDVADATRVRSDVDAPGGAPGDRVELTLADPHGFRTWTFGNAAPGSVQVDVGAPALVGEWQETSAGYRIELRLPRPAAPARVALRAIDAAAGGAAQTLELAAKDTALALVRADPHFDRVLAALAPDGARLRLLSNDGWVVGQAGTLVTPAATDPALTASRWQAWLYRLLLAPPAEAASDFDAERARIVAPVVWQALSGLPASSVRAAPVASAVVVTAAVPLTRTGAVHGALLLEQGSAALLVLANRAVFGVLAASLLAVVLGVLIVLAWSGVLSFRIRRLRDAAERALRPDGRLDPALPHLAARDDLGDLSRSFARLLGEVGTYTDYLRTLASKLSHELNTPLAIVRSSLDNLEHENLSDEADVYAQRARDGAERLGAILRSMAEASRVERAISSAEGEDFDLAGLVRGCAEAYRDLVAPRRLDVAVPAMPLGLHGAPELVAQALDKLVDNARSFAPPTGWIRIGLDVGVDGPEISVANEGPPLPERMHERLFDSLVSVRQPGDQRRPGGDAPHLGLGLFIVRLVAEVHRGAASARNLPDGSGVEFRITLKGLPRRPV